MIMSRGPCSSSRRSEGLAGVVDNFLFLRRTFYIKKIIPGGGRERAEFERSLRITAWRQAFQGLRENWARCPSLRRREPSAVGATHVPLLRAQRGPCCLQHQGPAKADSQRVADPIVGLLGRRLQKATDIRA